ncbi:hypothetical protein ABIB40_001880 [Pedobacter sp. UYP30]
MDMRAKYNKKVVLKTKSQHISAIVAPLSAIAAHASRAAAAIGFRYKVRWFLGGVVLRLSHARHIELVSKSPPPIPRTQTHR